MIKSIAFANAATLVTAAFFVLCVVISYIAPDLLFSVSKPWFHVYNVDAVKATEPMDITSAIGGLISMSVLMWVWAWGLIEVYNRLVK